MVAIKDMEMPKDCKKCPLMGTDGTPTDSFKPMMCIAIWATKHEIKHCVGGKILDDCPLVEIEERKVVDFIKLDDIVSQCPNCKVKFSVAANENREIKYCPYCGVKKRGSENG